MSSPYDIPRCGCGHLAMVHAPGRRGRGPCSASTCPCRRYTKERT